VFDARDSTRDIDAIFHPSADMRKIINSMAIDYDLPSDWLNDAVKPFITDKLTIRPHIKYSNLIVYSVDAESLLAMKLASARFGTSDMKDSIFLMKHLNIKTEKEIFDIIDKFIEPFLRRPSVKFFAIEAFQQYSHEYINTI